MRSVIGDWFSDLPTWVQLVTIVLLVAMLTFLFSTRYGRKSKQ